MPVSRRNRFSLLLDYQDRIPVANFDLNAGEKGLIFAYQDSLFGNEVWMAFYALEDRSTWFVLAFAGACALASAYGFLQGAWPFGLVEAIWSLVALRRWWLAQA